MKTIWNIKRKILVKLLNLSKLSLRYNHSDSITEINKSKNVIKEHNINDINDLEKKGDVRWTAGYKNLNDMLGIKGLNSNDLDLLNINKIKYLAFSLTDDSHNLSNKKVGDKYERDIFYSLKLVLSDLKNKGLYEEIICNLKKDSSLIDEGGTIDIYYVTSASGTELNNNNVKEGFRTEGYTKYKCLIPSITEVITLNKPIKNNKLIVNIYIFSYDTFFREYLTSGFKLFKKSDRIKNQKLWPFPFLFIEDMNLPTVIYLFKERGINFHGMSISWRHKLAPLEDNLAIFLYVAHLKATIETSNLVYKDKVFTNNKLDLQLYKDIYKIQEYNHKKISVFSKEIASIENEISQYPKEIYFQKKKLYFERKLQNLENNSMSNIAIVLLFRNHVFELKNNINEKKGIRNKILDLYQETDKSIKEEISRKDDFYVIVEKLKNEIEALEKKLSSLDVIIETKKELVNKNKIINQNDKKQKKIAVKSAKNKKKKEILKKKFMPDPAKLKEIAIQNEQLVRSESSSKKLLLKRKEKIQELNINKEKALGLNSKIEKDKSNLNNLDLDLKNSSIELENLSKSLDLGNNLSFSSGFFNEINNRSRKTNNNKSDFVSPQGPKGPNGPKGA